MFAFFVTTRFASALALIAMLSGLAAGVVFGLLAVTRRRRTGHCKDCAHWRPGDTRWFSEAARKCERLALPLGLAMRLMSVPLSQQGGPSLVDGVDDAVAADEGLWPDIYTGPDFGCIHWQGKDS